MPYYYIIINIVTVQKNNTNCLKVLFKKEQSILYNKKSNSMDKHMYI